LLDEKTGRMVYKKDQIFSSIANAFLRAMELKSPVAIIAGKHLWPTFNNSIPSLAVLGPLYAAISSS
jgi:hypothetical protein